MAWSASPPSAGIGVAHYAVVGERLQRLVGHGVDGERGGQRVHVQHVGGVGVLVEVLAHSSRCGRAPSLASRRQRGESSSSR